MKREQAWSKAFISEAKDNLRAASLLALNVSEAPSTFATLLQMTFEKLAKAYLLIESQGTVESIQTSHRAASDAFGYLRRHDEDYEVLERLGLKNMRSWRAALQLISELERAHPSLAPQGSAQLEYPWEDPVSGEVRWPAAHLALLERLCDPNARLAQQLLHLARRFVVYMERRLGEEG